MEFLGIKLTYEDMARITASVGSIALKMTLSADSDDDIKEAAELCKLHFKLTRAMAKATEHTDTEMS